MFFQFRRFHIHHTSEETIHSLTTHIATRFFPVRQADPGAVRKYFLWFCTFWLMMAGLEFLQDYVGATVNGNVFQLSDSLSYKLFWLLFIPFSLFAAGGLKILSDAASGPLYWAGNAILVTAVTLVHLLVFSVFLFGLSNLMHADPWTLPYLLAEKLSTRLYIGLSFYILLSAAWHLASRRGIAGAGEAPSEAECRERSDEPVKTITVKNGTRSVLVPTDSVKWISSDGPYLFLHTDEKKHIITDSLKNIICCLPSNFRRIHRSTIANTDLIEELRSRGNGDYDLLMADGTILRLSRNYARPVKEMLL